MMGDRLTVVLNDQTIIDDVQLPSVEDRGPIALQHHGTQELDGEWTEFTFSCSVSKYIYQGNLILKAWIGRLMTSILVPRF